MQTQPATNPSVMMLSMSTAEIIEQLPRLSSAELAQVQAKLRELFEQADKIPHLPRVHSPRLGRPEQSKDFIKQVVELAADAAL